MNGLPPETRAEKVRVCRLSGRDASDLLALERLCFTWPWNEDQVRAAFALREFRAIGLKCGARLLAYLSFYHLPPEMEILNLAVHPDLRRHGLGTRLLGLVLQWAGKRGIHTVHLEVRRSNVAALGLYAAHGFVQTGTRKKYYPDNGEDALVMRCDLTPAGTPPSPAAA